MGGLLKISENSFISLGLCLTLCSVSWRSSKIESTANSAVEGVENLNRELKAVENYMGERRNLLDDRLQAIRDSIAKMQIDVAVIKNRLPLK